jgi:hypothetical protein
LDLVAVAGSDVREGPTNFFADALLLRIHQCLSLKEKALIDDVLSLIIISCQTVAYSAQAGHLEINSC